MKYWYGFILVFLIGCAPLLKHAPASLTATPISIFEPLESPVSTSTKVELPAVNATPTLQVPITAENPESTPVPAIKPCSPLPGVLLEELTSRIVNPYHPPRMGSDDPHQGIDIAELQPGTSIAVSGLPVQAVLEGQVAGVILSRFPYGNAVLIETMLGDLPDPHQYLPTVMPTLQAVPALTCPTLPESFQYNQNHRSLYILYAHLKDPPPLKQNEPVGCGDVLGAIGDSGNALNPHLHLEIRVGPSGARFPGLAHYDNSASLEEMALYCTWRISGLFQHIDPLKILGVKPFEVRP